MRERDSSTLTSVLFSRAGKLSFRGKFLAKLIGIVCLIPLTLSHDAIADDAFPVYRPFALSQEINEASVNTVLRDRAGRLWIGTQNGLYKFDGESTEKYGPSRPKPYYLPDSHVSKLVEDQSGNVYAALFAGGIFRWTSNSSGFEKIYTPPELENLVFTSMIAKTSGVVWLASKNQIVTYHPEKSNSSAWRILHKITDQTGSPKAMLLNGKNDVLILGRDGLISASSGRNWKEILLPEHATAGASAFYTGDGANLYIGYNSGLVRNVSINTNKVTVISETQLTKGKVNEIAAFGKSLLFATDSGLIQTNVDLTNARTLRANSVSAAVAVDDLFLDKGSIWIGTLEGLYLLTFSGFGALENFPSGRSRIVYALGKSSNHDLLVGTYDALYSYKTNAGFRSSAIYSTPRLELDRGVSSISTLGDRTFVGLFDGGVLELAHKADGVDFDVIPKLDSQTITSMSSDELNNELWVGTYRNGLYQIKEKVVQSYLANGELPESAVTLVHLSQYSRELFVVSFDKIYRYSRLKDEFVLLDFQFEDQPKHPTIYSMRESSDGDLWIGTKNRGLFRLSARSRASKELILKKLVGAGDIQHSTIYGITIDNGSGLWCSTQNGIIKYDVNTSKIDWYTREDGILWSDFSLGALHKSEEGVVFFGGSGGLTYFQPHKIEKAKEPPKAVLSSIELGASSEKFDLGNTSNKAISSYRDRYVSFGFTSLNFIDPTKNQYRYKLENFDDDWINSGSRNKATYTNLPSGEYRFTVQAANSSGIWNPDGASIDLVVLPPPWLTGWAYSLYFILASMFLWGLHRIYYSFVIDKKANELAFEMHLAEERADDDMQGQIELQQDLVQSAYEHNKTTLALVAELLPPPANDKEQNGTRDSAGHQSRLATLAYLEECLYFQAGGSVVDLNKLTEKVFELVLPQASVTPSSIITINGVTKQLIPASIASPVSLIICELVENAIIHGFAPQSPANYIQVAFSRSAQGDDSGDHWLLEVSDNGTGVDLQQYLTQLSMGDISNNTDEKRPGRGLQIVRQLADQLEASIQTKVAGGSAISFQIPAGPSY